MFRRPRPLPSDIAIPVSLQRVPMTRHGPPHSPAPPGPPGDPCHRPPAIPAGGGATRTGIVCNWGPTLLRTELRVEYRALLVASPSLGLTIIRKLNQAVCKPVFQRPNKVRRKNVICRRIVIESKAAHEKHTRVEQS